MTQTQNVTDTEKLNCVRYLRDIEMRMFNGSLHPQAIRNALNPLIGKGGLPDETSHLKAISGLLDLPATKKGKGINPKGTKPFGWVDSDFDNWNAHTEQKDTNATFARVYEQTKDGTFQNLFGSFGKDLNLLQFETEEQIIAFVLKYGSDYVHKDGRGTFFLFQNPQGERFVAYVYWNGSELDVYVRRLSNDNVWRASNGHRVVVLQQSKVQN